MNFGRNATGLLRTLWRPVLGILVCLLTFSLTGCKHHRYRVALAGSAPEPPNTEDLSPLISELPLTPSHPNPLSASSQFPKGLDDIDTDGNDAAEIPLSIAENKPLVFT